MSLVCKDISFILAHSRILLKFVMRDNRLGVWLSTYSINGIVIEFIIIDGGLDIWLTIKVFDIMYLADRIDKYTPNQDLNLMD